MRALLFTAYTIPARRIAEAMWGTGGTHSYRTNRRGAYYYSCAGHGGYVVDSRCLTDEEKKLIDEYHEVEVLQLLIQHRTDGDYVIGQDPSGDFKREGMPRKRTFRYNKGLGDVEWISLDIYIFEEDCDWATLEKLTKVRAKHEMSDDKRQEYIDKTFAQWATKN